MRLESTAFTSEEQPKIMTVKPDAGLRQRISDFVALTKPRIISLLLATTLVPMFLAGEKPPSLALIGWVMLGGFLAAGGANALNQYWDRDIDHVMPRTRKRPLPGSRMLPWQVLVFGILLSGLSVVVLWWSANLLTAMLALAGNLFYVIIYTGLVHSRHWWAGRQWQMIFRCCRSSCF